MGKTGSVKAKASDPTSKPVETQITPMVSTPQISNVLFPAETANAPGRPERPASLLNRPFSLKHRKLRPGLPPTIISRRSSGQIKKMPDLRREDTFAGEHFLGRGLPRICPPV